MKALRFFSFLVFLFAPDAEGQTWTALGDSLDGSVIGLYSDTASGSLIAYGTFDRIGSMQVDGIAAWDGVAWHPIATGINTGFNPVYAVCRFQEELYSEGLLGSSNSGSQSVLKLDVGDWEDIGLVNGGVRRLRALGDKMYAVGTFDSIAGIEAFGVAAWDGVQWEAVGNDLSVSSTFPAAVSDIAQYQGELYVTGKFDDGQGLANIAKLVNGTWQPVANGISTWNGFGSELLVFQDMLYVAGFFQEEEGNVASNIMAWDGVEWFSPQGGVTFSQGEGGFLRSITTDGDFIYVAGVFDAAGGLPISEIARWDGQNWCGFDVWTNNVARTLIHYQNELIVSGAFYWVNSSMIPHIAKSEYYTDLCGEVGIENMSNEIHGLTVHPNPTNSTVTIDLTNTNPQDEVIVNLYDVHGRLLEVPLTIDSENVELDLTTLPTGMYFGQVVFGKKIRTFKVVRE